MEMTYAIDKTFKTCLSQEAIYYVCNGNLGLIKQQRYQFD